MPQTANQIQEMVQQALGRFEQLADSDAPPTQVLTELLDTLVQATGSLGAVAWMPTDKSLTRFRAITRAGNVSAIAIDRQADPPPSAEPIITQAAQQRQCVIIGPDSPEFDATELHHTAQFFVPMDAMSRCFGVIQMITSGDIDPKVYRQFAAFAQQAARAAGTYLARRQTEVVNDSIADQAALLQVTHKLLAMEKPQDLIHELATLSRAMLESMRVAVVGYWRKRGDIAFSDTIKVDRKAVVVRDVELLADFVRKNEAPMIFTKGQELDDEDQHLEPLLDQVFNQSGGQAICLTPMRDDDKVIGVMVADYPAPDFASRRADVQQQICRQCGPILARTAAAHHRPLRRTSNLLDSIRRHPLMNFSRAGFIIAALALAVYGLFFMPVDIVIRANARLEPASMAQVTAPVEGRIQKVFVETGQDVKVGDILLKIDDTDLKESQREIETEIRVEESKQEAARSRQKSRDPAVSQEAAHEFTSIELSIERLKIRLDRTLARIEETNVRATIDGVVLDEKPHRLEDMTVAAGDLLIRVADLNDFELLAELHEEDLALVEEALGERRDVPVTFLSHAWPDKPQQAAITSLQSLAPTSVPDEYQRQHIFRVTTPVELHDIGERMVLANPTGRAKLITGQGSVAYRYGRGVWRFIQMTLLF